MSADEWFGASIITIMFLVMVWDTAYTMGYERARAHYKNLGK